MFACVCSTVLSGSILTGLNIQSNASHSFLGSYPPDLYIQLSKTLSTILAVFSATSQTSTQDICERNSES